MSAPQRAYVGLGSNLGDAQGNVRNALARLGRLPETRLLRASRLYRTDAWGVRDQPDFINAVALLETALDARQLLQQLLDVETEYGRQRSNETRWGPRTLDLDLLLYADAVIDAPGLRVPHPHLHERAFALLPLLEIAPDALIPGIGSVCQAAAGMAADGVQALG